MELGIFNREKLCGIIDNMDFLLLSRGRIREIAQNRSELKDSKLTPFLTEKSLSKPLLDPCDKYFKSILNDTVYRDTLDDYDRAEWATFWLSVYYVFPNIAFPATIYNLIRYVQQEKLFLDD